MVLYDKMTIMKQGKIIVCVRCVHTVTYRVCASFLEKYSITKIIVAKVIRFIFEH